MSRAARIAFALLVACAACRSRIAGERESDLAVGLGGAVGPGAGVALTAAQRFHPGTERSDFAFEMTGTFGSVLDAGAAGSGDFFQVQAGVKQTLSPGHPRRPVVRYGLTWLRATSSSSLLDEAGDYFGGYAGVGYEWDLSPRWTIAPQVNALLLGGEGSIGFTVAPQALLQVIFRF